MIRILLQLVKYICFCLAIQFATHPSKDPTVLWLYSNDKSLAILVLIIIGIILHKIKSNFSEKEELPIIKYPFLVAFVVIISSYFFQINTNLVLGCDFADQFKSLIQWVNGTTTNWNNIKQFDINDIRESKETWLFRPPGAMIYYTPFVNLGIPLGESLRLAHLILSLSILYSWYKIGNIFKLNENNKFILCICLSLWLSTLFSFIGNLQLLVTAYSSLLTMIVLKQIIGMKNEISLYDHLRFLFISILLGTIVLIKVSALIYNSAIFLFFISFMIMNSFDIKNKKIFLFNSISCVFASMLFIAPFIILNLINNINGFDVDDVYKQDYNNNPFYQSLWGDFFIETTEFPAVTISFLSSWATFSPLNTIQTLCSNALTYLGFVDNFLYGLELNPKVIYKAITGICFSIPIFYLVKIYKFKNEIKSYFIISVLTVPFILFMITTNRHGYNYLITGTYNQQYLPFFILFILIIKSKRDFDINIFPKSLLFFFSIIFFTFSNAQSLFSNIKKNLSKNELGSENINNKFYGNEVNKVCEVINLNRKDLNTPIFFFANTSISEISILFNGNIGGIAGANAWCKNSNSHLETFNQKMFLLFDSRLNSEQINSLLNKIKYTKIQTILNLSDSSKVYLLN